MAGLLGEDYEDPATQGLLSAGLSMLAASGPSTKRTSVGQVLGLGGLQGMQAYQAAQKMALLKAEEERRKQEAAAMEQYRNAQIQELLAKAERQKALAEKGVDERTPSNVLEALWYQQATPEQRKAYDTTRRAQQLTSIGGVNYIRNSESGAWEPIRPMEEVLGNIRSTVGTKEETSAQYQLDKTYDPATGREVLQPRLNILRQSGVGGARPPGANQQSSLPAVESPQSVARQQGNVLAQEGQQDSPYARSPSTRPLDLSWNGQQFPTLSAVTGGGVPAGPSPEEAARAAAAKKAAEGEQERLGKLRESLPKVMESGNLMLQTIEQAAKHPGLPYYVGVASVLPDDKVIPGTPQADFQSIFDQIKGQAFMKAYNDLKGGGQITEVEGEKGTAAITRLQNRKLSPKDWVEAANELSTIIRSAMSRASAQSNGAKWVTSKSEVDALPPGSIFIAPDGSIRRKE